MSAQQEIETIPQRNGSVPVLTEPALSVTLKLHLLGKHQETSDKPWSISVYQKREIPDGRQDHTITAAQEQSTTLDVAVPSLKPLPGGSLHGDFYDHPGK